MNNSTVPAKILVVDDNPRNIQVIGTILREANYDVGFAMDGHQAIELLQDSNDYDLVLLDIRMPLMNGLEVCSIMRKDDRFKEIPVIFLSASQELENIIAAFDAGGVDYVTKPFNAKELLARVNTHLQLKFKTREARNYARELELVNATKDKFFSIIAHDLRNPFEGILLISRTLLKNLPKCSAEEITKQVEIIISATDTGNKLLENLLIWSRSQTGRVSYHPRDLPLEPMVQQCIDNVIAWAKAKEIDLAFTSDENIVVKTDEDMFCHILRNLLTNALKFTPSNGRVTVVTGKSGDGIEVSVSDTGIGISEQDKGRIFRIDGNISSRPGTENETGSGLGLILCKEFIDKMGGTIRVESRLGEGSRFSFWLPGD